MFPSLSTMFSSDLISRAKDVFVMHGKRCIGSARVARVIRGPPLSIDLLVVSQPSSQKPYERALVLVLILSVMSFRLGLCWFDIWSCINEAK